MIDVIELGNPPEAITPVESLLRALFAAAEKPVTADANHSTAIKRAAPRADRAKASLTRREKNPSPPTARA
jgi:hypothetical protein